MNHKSMFFLLLACPVLFGMQERKNGGPERAHAARKEKKHVSWADGVPTWHALVHELPARAGERELCNRLSELAFVRECEVRSGVYKCSLCGESFNGATAFVTHVGHHDTADIVKLVLRP